MSILKTSFIIALTLLALIVNAQVKPSVSLDSKTSGGFYQNYFDLGENGFIVVLNKSKNDIKAPVNTKESSNTAYYFSKDLTKRTIIRFTSIDNTSFLANENFIVLLEKNLDAYNIKLFDYNGKLVSTKRLDLNQAGLSNDKVSRTFLSSGTRINYEVYDLMQGVHIFYNDLTLPGQNDIIEADISFPNSNLFESVSYPSEWKFLTENKGYYTFYRIGNNKQYNPDHTILHLAICDKNFELFRELNSHNILQSEETLQGKEFSLDLNIAQQCFYLSYINKISDKYGFCIQKYMYDNANNTLKRITRKDVDLINNSTFKFVETDGISSPKVPLLKQNGSDEEVVIAKDRLSSVDETVNQIYILDNSDNVKFNEVQTGDFDMLNLDGFCGDNGKMYSRFDKMMMKNVLKQICEYKRCEVLDIAVDEKGNELLITQNTESNIVNIYRFVK
ncbi:MAG: hypothetical protein EBZ58_04765 [Bacteroidetes bacterium]|nr:hypothetical protein [Bacteroidota bacterium]